MRKKEKREKMQKIKFLQETRVAVNGIHAKTYAENDVIEVDKLIAKSLINGKQAKEFGKVGRPAQSQSAN